jgi:hypothetical protein
MTEQELRQLVRGVIAERAEVWLKPDATPPDPTVIPLTSIRGHASHALFVIPAEGEACLIEPTVPCNHCGYCKSYGH